ncbi:hypothetical protein [Nostoc sp. LPT]|uniref:hypothetical protein n=1 Tax=Nostoc sp. LPT TaxID=2815387 RepID=UPI001D404DAB|nr:hypothetical protein [Nostoc sp. LPT]MBN4002807.1 hypothetical protein [Nostoc sp. LPT]
MSKKRGFGIPWQPRQNSGKTTPIRVPIALKDDILAYARAVDSKTSLTGEAIAVLIEILGLKPRPKGAAFQDP